MTALSRSVLVTVATALIAGCSVASSSLPSGGPARVSDSRTAGTEKVLYSFTDGTDGGGPNGGLAFDGSGNVFGTTHFGGDDTCGGEVGGGCGVVFELMPSGSTWSESAIYTFEDGTGGGFPNSGVILDKSDNVLGTAATGGSSNCSIGCGVVYELSKGSGWAESVLHTFTGSDGEYPNATLLASKSGALYSTTWYGGSSGNGTVFALTPSGSGYTESVLYNFGGGTDGSSPAAGVIADRSGNLYGTTYKYDGDNDGVTYELEKRASWKDRVLYAFTNNGGGENPYAGVIMPSKGTLFGTAIESGSNDGGVVYEMTSGKKHAWTESVLHAFGATGDGNAPYGGVVADKSGNLFGTTVFGGTNNAGAVYELSPKRGGTWKYHILYSFTGGSDGQYPSGGLTLDSHGNLFGATSDGGASGYGVIFEISL